MRPRLFVGSSSEGLEVANAIQENLDDDAEVTVWTQGFFEPSRGTLETLVGALSGFDFGVFVLSGDDLLTLREEEQRVVRDNVTFEMGLFVGSLGRQAYFLRRTSR